MPPPIGKSFQPGADDQQYGRFGSGGPGRAPTPAQSPIRLLNLRLPRVIGSNAPINELLLNSPGGQAFGDSQQAVMRALEAMSRPETPPMASPMPGVAMPPPPSNTFLPPTSSPAPAPVAPIAPRPQDGRPDRPDDSVFRKPQDPDRPRPTDVIPVPPQPRQAPPPGPPVWTPPPPRIVPGESPAPPAPPPDEAPAPEPPELPQPQSQGPSFFDLFPQYKRSLFEDYDW